jgi:hypothetical protein
VYVAAAADPGPMLSGLLPVLVARMGRVPVEEPSEEVRLAAQELIQEVVKAASIRCVQGRWCMQNATSRTVSLASNVQST